MEDVDCAERVVTTTMAQSYSPNVPSEATTMISDTIHVELTPHDLDVSAAIRFVRSSSAGATVLFIGTTRDSFNNLPVNSLTYTSYAPLAISTLHQIASSVLVKHSCTKIAIMHKLGECPIGQESIVIAVSAPHRQAGWRAGEEALEETKAKAEIWKLEKFRDGEQVWKANRDEFTASTVGTREKP